MLAGGPLTEVFSDDFQVAIVGALCRNPEFAYSAGQHLDGHHFSQVYGGRYLGLLVDWAKAWHWSQGRARRPYPWDVAVQQAWEWSREAKVGDPRTHWSNLHQLLYRAFTDQGADQLTASRVYEWITHREEMALLVQAKEVKDRGGSLADINLAQKVAEIRRIGVEDAGITLSAAQDIDALNQIAAARKRDTFPLRGHSTFQTAMKGGPARSEMILFAGPTNVGKTTTVCSVAANWVEMGFSVAHYSLEQSDTEVLKKYVCGISKMSSDQYDLWPDYRRQWLEYICTKRGRLYIRQFPSGASTLNDIRADLLTQERKLGAPFDIVIIDYPDLLKLPNPTDRRGSLIQLYTEFRGMAIEMGFLAVAPTQTNRGSVGKEAIHVDDLAEAFDKGAITDFMVGLGQTEEDYGNSIVNWFLAKNRVGEKFILRPVSMNFDSCQSSERTGGAPRVETPKSMPYVPRVETLGSMVRPANPQVFPAFRPGPGV